MDPLARHQDATWTLTGLAEAARGVLSQAPHPPKDERVTPFPDERTLRWYRSLGLLDPPGGSRGREGVYTWRHLLQAVAVKLLQGEGHTLAQIQKALVGAETAALEHRVRTALGLRRDARPLRAFLTTELAPGVLVTLDPNLVADPDGLLARLATTLAGT